MRERRFDNFFYGIAGLKNYPILGKLIEATLCLNHDRNEVERGFNPLLINVLILYPLKTPENQWFSGVFRGYEMGTLVREELMLIKIY